MELVDTLAWGASALTGVQVQVLSTVPVDCLTYYIMIANKNYIISSNHNLNSVFADLNKKNTQLNSLKITDSDFVGNHTFQAKSRLDLSF